MLKYAEDYYNTKIFGIDEREILIEKICPKSSGTIEKQDKETEILTIVTFLEKEYSDKIKDIVNMIGNLGYNFITTKRLHSTLLSLPLSSNLTWNKFYENLVKDTIKKFFHYNYQSGIKFNLKFKFARPGTWYGLNQNPIPNASDGTVILYGNYKDNKEFVNCGKNLARELRDKLPYIFNYKFDRKLFTIWITLGYFNYSDFDITYDHKFEETFKKLESNSVDIEVNELRIVKSKKRSLEDAEILLKINNLI